MVAPTQTGVAADANTIREFANVYTAEKNFALTFNGMGTSEIMLSLLDELDKYNLTATFFLPAERVAEEPYIAAEILQRGHEIENNITLLTTELGTPMEYEEMLQEVQVTNAVFKRELGMTPKYVRPIREDYPLALAAATEALLMRGVVWNDVDLSARNVEEAQTAGSDVEQFLKRGSILNMDIDRNPALVSSIASIAGAIKNVGYEPLTLNELVLDADIRLPYDEIPGTFLNPTPQKWDKQPYKELDFVETEEKVIAFTFDDFGSDKNVNDILDVLAEYQVPATFFLRVAGVEKNPNLARAMVEQGHDVASHSYAHSVLTTMTDEEIIADTVKGNEILTEALQQAPLPIYRPPAGAVDERTGSLLAAMGYQVIARYDVNTLDWDPSLTATDIYDNVMSTVRNGSFMLFHLLDNINTIAALPRIIQGLRAQGYTFVTMSELLKLEPSPVIE
jgi:peptidoglycan/xylan/chitin deacetylase (PgdA/CDA1 family)